MQLVKLSLRAESGFYRSVNTSLAFSITQILPQRMFNDAEPRGLNCVERCFGFQVEVSFARRAAWMEHDA